MQTSQASSKMELVYFSNEFPKDDLQQLYRRLQNHGKSNDHTMLASFIQNATSAIKDEVRQLPTELKQQIPPFESLLSWADRTDLREGSLCGAVDGVLLVVTQIAAYIGWVDLFAKYVSSENVADDKSQIH
jgi:monodictyphenone polyketide synthase